MRQEEETGGVHGGRRRVWRKEEGNMIQEEDFMVGGGQILTGSFDLLLGGLVPHVAEAQNCIVILILCEGSSLHS